MKIIKDNEEKRGDIIGKGNSKKLKIMKEK
jgi:hypothetical protein